MLVLLNPTLAINAITTSSKVIAIAWERKNRRGRASDGLRCIRPEIKKDV
jgi:hypothetical protein